MAKALQVNPAESSKIQQNPAESSRIQQNPAKSSRNHSAHPLTLSL
jgi:hypothetical protein